MNLDFPGISSTNSAGIDNWATKEQGKIRGRTGCFAKHMDVACTGSSCVLKIVVDRGYFQT